MVFLRNNKAQVLLLEQFEQDLSSWYERLQQQQHHLTGQISSAVERMYRCMQVAR
jgi:hypothetical protein